GIRDLTVTGVQTCALPIFPEAERFAVLGDGLVQLALAMEDGGEVVVRIVVVLLDPDRLLVLGDGLVQPAFVFKGATEVVVRTWRSEERRVGKECRCRGWGL